MKSIFINTIRVVCFVATLYFWKFVLDTEVSQLTAYALAIVPILLVFVVSWVARKTLEVKPTMERMVWITSVLHIVIMVLLGALIIEAIKLFSILHGVTIPLPVEIGVVLLCFTAACTLLTVLNLALSGLGAPFAIVLSRRIADRWMYRWTRNPMVLCTIATLFSAGLYFQSLYFVLWVVLLVTPAWIYYLKIYEERELEIRFGPSYLEYKAKTPFIWPGKQKA